MPIRFRDQQSYLARISSVLAGHTSATTGSFQTAANRTGTMPMQLAQMTAAIQGNHVFAQNRTGAISASLQNTTSSIFGTLQSIDGASFAARNSGVGVVWYQNFETIDEVDNFRFQNAGTTPQDPTGGIAKDITLTDGNCRWVPFGGPDGGGYLEMNMPTGGKCTSGWVRPFSALQAGANSNGRATADPGANGTITPRAYNALVRSQYDWQFGLYGHPDYQSGAAWDGFDFHIQARIRISAARANVANPPGKLIYVDVPNGGDQELIVTSRSDDNVRFDMYTNFGSRNNSYLTAVQGNTPSGAVQPGSQHSPLPWRWPLDEWVTLLMRITPGRRANLSGQNDVVYGGTPATNNTGIEMWAARANETTYTKIWSKLDYVWAYDTLANGFNSLKLSGYMNNVNAAQGWTHQFAQVIFSKQPIPCPSTAPPWFAAQTERTWITIGTNSASSVGAPPAVMNAWTGACPNDADGELLMPAPGGHNDYGGNELWRFRVRSATPSWDKLTNASSATGGDPTRNGRGDYADGLIRSSHTSTRVVYAKGRAWVVAPWGMASGSGLTETTTAIWSCDRASMGIGPFPVASAPWVFHGKGQATIPSSQSDYSGEGGAVVYDPIGQTIWSVPQYAISAGGFSVNVSDPTNVVITSYNFPFGGNPFGGGGWGVCVADSAANRWFIMGSPNESRLWVLNLANVGAGWRQVGTTGTTGWTSNGSAVYHAPSRKIIVYGHSFGATLRTLTVPANPYTSAASGFVWGTITNNAGGATPPGSIDGDFAGVYSKFNMIQNMGNGQSCLVAVFRNTGSVYAYKLPASV